MTRRAHDSCADSRLELIRWTASLGAVSAEALATRAQISAPAARARLAGAHRRGLLARARPLAELPALYTVTTAGLRACAASTLRAARVSPATATHMYACARVAAQLERCYPDHLLLGECELRAIERARGRPLASAELGRGRCDRPLLHRCDLALVSRSHPHALPLAIEVELTVKAPARLAAICRAWARCGHVAGVLYVGPPAVVRALERAVQRAQAHARVVVVALDALLDVPATTAGRQVRADTVSSDA